MFREEEDRRDEVAKVRDSENFIRREINGGPIFKANKGSKSGMCEVFKGEKLGKRGVSPRDCPRLYYATLRAHFTFPNPFGNLTMYLCKVMF